MKILRIQDLKAKLLETVSPEIYETIAELSRLESDIGFDYLEEMQEKLLDALPRHDRLIKHIFAPECFPMTSEEKDGHRYCRLDD